MKQMHCPHCGSPKLRKAGPSDPIGRSPLADPVLSLRFPLLLILWFVKRANTRVCLQCGQFATRLAWLDWF